jgi:alpha-ribazole phosphatase
LQIALIRHTAPLVAPGICYGRLDVDVRDVAEFAAVRAGLGGFRGAHVWSSPARRCRLLAEAIAADATIDGRLAELNFGAWEGLPWDAIPRDPLDRWAADPAGFAPPGGESGAALIARVTAFHAALVSAIGDQIVVSHGGPLKILQALLAGREPDLLAPAPAWGSVIIFSIIPSFRTSL